MLIADSVDGRTEKDSQLAFIDNANFILVVNRKVDSNDVVKKSIKPAMNNLPERP